MNNENLEKRKNKFIETAKIIHSNEKIDYSKVVYVNNRTPVCLIDRDLRPDGNEYGEFWQTPSNHLKGHSHPDKKSKKISKNRSANQEDIIERFKLAHPNENIDYSEVVYVNMHTKVKIIDRDLNENGIEYGEFWQEPIVHLKGCGHPLKGKGKQIIKQSSNTVDFIEKSKKIHLHKCYDYSRVNYVNNKTKVDIICPKHGIFSISPDNFLQGKGCPKCGNHLSIAEDEIVEILSKYYAIERNNRTILNGLEIDIYIPEIKTGIEYNGLRWHSEEFGKDKYYHLNKTNTAKEKGVKLIQIFEDEYLLNKELVINKILHIAGISDCKEKIAARKCVIKEINKDESRLFLNKNHIQGFTQSTIYLGAYFCNNLVAVMSFTKIKEEWILSRFASDYNYIFQGVGGKLFNYFLKKFNPTYIKSFADRRWTVNEDDNLYIKLGFIKGCILPPDYRYYNYKLYGNERKHKFGFRKKILSKKYGFNVKMTETEMVNELGCYKIWDCGLVKYVWRSSAE